jgi:putative ABC transport system permease protein
MGKLPKIAFRNLLRYRRRTLLTLSLLTLGVVFVLVFVSVSGSFKAMMIAQNTDSMLGHLQVHRKGYVASIDTLPLNLNLKAGAVGRLEKALAAQPEIEAYSLRVKFGAMFSTFTETTNIRLNGVDPAREFAAVPLLAGRSSREEEHRAGGDLGAGTPRQGDEGQGGGHRGGHRHEPGRLGEREAAPGLGHSRERDRPRGTGRLHPHR